MSLQDNRTLNNGVKIPIVGFGTWQMPEGEHTENIVEHAIRSGYRHIDTAKVYGNETSVGKAIKASGIDREDLFVTTKLWNDAHGYEEAKQAIDESLKKLDLDYVDLYLIHWPNPKQHRDNWEEPNAEAWKAMEEAVEAGKIKAIGISNFMIHHIEALLKTTKIKPVVNQIYLNPSDHQEEVVQFCRDNDILVEAYSPLGSGRIFEIDELQEIALKYDKSVAQIVLRWHLDKGFVPLPKTATMERVVENADIFDFELLEEDIKKIDSFEGVAGTHSDPDQKDF